MQHICVLSSQARSIDSCVQALLEAMEQQEVSVAKAGLVASLPARTAVVAAANPIGGRYDRGKTLRENLKLSPAMLSRFDLTFVLLDRPDEALDQALSEHVLAMHSGKDIWGTFLSRAMASVSQGQGPVCKLCCTEY